MTTLAARIAEARADLDLSKAELARSLGVTQATVGALESGAVETLPEAQLLPLAQSLRVNPRWLLTGRGAKRAAASAPAPRPEGAASYTFVTRVYGPMLSAGAGRISWEHEEIDSSHAFRRDWLKRKGLTVKSCRIISVEGDSMSPYLQHGDVVLVDLADCGIRDGEVYAIAMDDQLRVKRLAKRHDGAVEIRSDNPAPCYAPELIEADRAERLQVIGRVVWRGG